MFRKYWFDLIGLQKISIWWPNPFNDGITTTYCKCLFSSEDTFFMASSFNLELRQPDKYNFNNVIINKLYSLFTLMKRERLLNFYKVKFK